MDTPGEWTLLHEFGHDKTYIRSCESIVQFLRLRTCRHSALTALRQDVERWNAFALSPVVVSPSDTNGILSFVSTRAEGSELGAGQFEAAHEGSPATSLGHFLRAAVMATRALARIHRAGLVHGNIKPSNIFVTASEATIVDPTFETLAEESLRNLRSSYVLERVLPYLAPERTGRMNRAADERSDLYSLGIAFFEVLSRGAPPFTSTDPLEIIHAHLARPMPLDRLGSHLPNVLVAIVSRLLEKDPARRYQSANGLLTDLEACSRLWKAQAHLPSFELGRADVPQTLDFEGMLYGREVERQEVEAALSRACEGHPSLILLSGPPGIGKSALGRLVTRLAHVRGCHVGTGKCDQLVLERPYFAFREALTEIGSQVLQQREEALMAWRTRFDASMEGLGGVIYELCPLLERIVGQQPVLALLEPDEARARIRMAAQRLIKLIATCGRPVVLFLDDLHWADSGTFDLLEHSLKSAVSLPLLVVGSYRSAEVNETHPVSLMAQSIAESGIPVSSFSLEPLSTSSVGELLAALFARSEAAVRELAEVIHERTLGNPFFVRALLQSLVDTGAVSFDGQWNWDTKRLRTQQAADNVVELLCHSMGRMGADTRQVLEYAALFGSSVTLDDLSLTLECDLTTLLTRLEPATLARLVQLREGRLTFTHDRVQEAALAMTDPEQLPVRHLEIANALRQNLDRHELERRVFEHVSHLNAGHAVLPTSERLNLARMNLRALERAKRAAAFGTAFAFARAGIACLDASDWQSDYSLCFELQRAHAELTFHLGHFSQSEALSSALAEKAQNEVDAASASALLVKAYIVQARFDEAIELASAALGMLGVDMPLASDDIARRFIEERAVSERLLAGREPAELADIGPMQDPRAKLALEMLVRVNPAIFFRRPDMLGLNIVLMANLSLEHGHTPVSAFAYAEFGFLCALESEDHGRAYAFTLLGLRLADLSMDPAQICRVTHLAAWIQHYTRPLREAEELFRRGFQAGSEAGEWEWAAYHAYGHAARLLLLGTELEETRREIERLREYVRRANSVAIVQLLDALHGQIDFLTQTTERHEHTERSDARLRLWQSSKNPQAEFIHRSFRALSLMLEHRYDEALEHAERALALQEHAPNHPFVELAHFVRGLAAVARLSRGQAVPDEAVEESRRLEKLATLCPENYLARRLLLQAEIGRVQGRGWENGRIYSAACKQASGAKLLHEEGLAHQLAARFWLALDQTDYCEVHARRARACWARWNASYLSMLIDDELKLSSGNSDTRDGFDARSLVKASQAISSELDRSKLHSRIMHVLLENAGADRGALVTPGVDGLEIVANATAYDATDAGVRRLNDESWVLEEVVRYTYRTGENVVIADASEDVRLSGNRQMQLRKIRSVLCLPIGPTESMLGVLYLENSQVTGAFTTERLALVEVLASQASISMENAALFARSQRAEKTLLASEEDLRITLDSIGDAVVATDAEGKILRMNAVACRLSGWLLEEARARPSTEVLQIVDAATREAAEDLVLQVVRTGRRVERSSDTILTSSNGMERRVSECGAPIQDALGQVVGVVLVLRDVTERHEFAERLRHAQQLEALGRLAGGVAHDFNNMLAGILGSAEFLAAKAKHSAESELNWAVKTIIDSALRAGDLTKQLLAFSRKGRRVSTLVNVHDIIAEALALLARSIDRSIRIEQSLCSDSPLVMGDPALLQSALLNLGVNGRDAMPNGGVLRVSTRISCLQQIDCELTCGFDLRPGDYVEISVTDNGHGMPPQVLERIFEPFFTTKPPGKGTGLGLAAVHGTVVAHGGAIRVESDVGQGTKVVLLIPKQRSSVSYPPAPILPEVQRRRLRVLVIDDEPLARVASVKLLELLGHRTLVACDGREGVGLFAQTPAQIDLVLLDAVMPCLGGGETFRQLRALRSNVPIVMVSGLPHESVVDQLMAEGLDGFLMKPFTLLGLKTAIDNVLRAVGPLESDCFDLRPGAVADARLGKAT